MSMDDYFICDHFKINKDSCAYKRVSAGSFKIMDRIIRSVVPEHYRKESQNFRFDWFCVCGRQEATEVYWLEIQNCYLSDENKIDVAKVIEDRGGISEDHLREDGFSEHEIKQIRIAYL